MRIIGIALIIVGAALIVLEMHTLTVYLLAVAAACIAGGVVGLAGGGPMWALLAIVLTGALALALAHSLRRRLKNPASEEVSRDDTGHPVTVIEAEGGTLRVMYRGTTWSARLRDSSGAQPQAGRTLIIAAREGSTLILDPPPPATEPSSRNEGNLS